MGIAGLRASKTELTVWTCAHPRDWPRPVLPAGFHRKLLNYLNSGPAAALDPSVTQATNPDRIDVSGGLQALVNGVNVVRR